jgi:hypothetical protein
MVTSYKNWITKALFYRNGLLKERTNPKVAFTLPNSSCADATYVIMRQIHRTPRE